MQYSFSISNYSKIQLASFGHTNQKCIKSQSIEKHWLFHWTVPHHPRQRVTSVASKNVEPIFVITHEWTTFTTINLDEEEHPRRDARWNADWPSPEKRSERNSSMILSSRGKKRNRIEGKGRHGKSRYERTGGAGLLTPGPKEHPTDHPTTDGTKLRGNAIGRDKSSLSSTTESLPGLFRSVHERKSIGHLTKSWILETWVDSLADDGVDSFSSALTVFHVDGYLLLFRFFMPQFRALDPPWLVMKRYGITWRLAFFLSCVSWH